ncbi:MAG: TIGR02147 family protein [Pseudobdellovibrionaceae bacterium]
MHGPQFEFAKNTINSDTSNSAPAVSDYLDYRQYLAHFFEYKRKQTASDLRPYSYATFSAAANIKSPNYLKMIIEGRRNLSEEMVLKFAKALGLNKEATEDFALLVSYGQATDPANRNMFLKELSEHRVQVKLKRGEIDQKTWDKIPNWAAWVIYAMVDQEGVSYDTKTLKDLLRGKASEAEIEQALQSLFKSGELIQDPETGKVKKAHTLIEAAEDVPVALVRKLQAQLMYLGLESLYQDAATEREFGTLTMSLTKQEFEEIKFKLRQMRKQINKDNSIARASSKGEKVYQLNIQLFPVSNASSSTKSAEKQSKEDASH